MSRTNMPTRRRRVARLGLWVATSALAGASVSLAIAWATAWIVNRPATLPEYFPIRHDDRRLLGSIDQGFGVSRGLYLERVEDERWNAVHERIGRGPRWIAAEWAFSDGARATGYSVQTYAYGIPFRCMRSVKAHRYRGMPQLGAVELFPAFGWWSITPTQGVPTMLVWPGFITNAAIYGAPVFILGWGIGATRRWRRRRRGACEGCGYSLVGNVGGTCPECGNRVGAATKKGVEGVECGRVLGAGQAEAARDHQVEA
jgi:hypothetical protein